MTETPDAKALQTDIDDLKNKVRELEQKKYTLTVYDWAYIDPETGYQQYARTPENAELLQNEGIELIPVYTIHEPKEVNEKSPLEKVIVKPLEWVTNEVFGKRKRRGMSPFGEWAAFTLDGLTVEQISKKMALIQKEYEECIISALSTENNNSFEFKGMLFERGLTKMNKRRVINRIDKI